MKEVIFIADSLDQLRKLPGEVQSDIGFALWQAQNGEKSRLAKPLKGVAATEIAIRYDKNAYRGVYTTKIKDKVIVLHVFQKKSKKGIATPKKDLDIITKRLKEALATYDS